MSVLIFLKNLFSGGEYHFKKWPKIPRLENETFTITEKIDGTNACVAFTDWGEMFCQSRKNFITPKKDNYGFASWCHDNRSELEKLGPGHHFGEWWGYGINRGYGLKERKFSLFNIYTSSIPTCCDIVPILCRDASTDINTLSKIYTWELQSKGSKAVSSYMNPEGIIIQSNTYPQIRWKVIINK